MINVELNGQDFQVDQGSTVTQLLEKAKLPSRFCAVELNLEILPKDEFGTRQLSHGDKLEIVTLVGGG